MSQSEQGTDFLREKLSFLRSVYVEFSIHQLDVAGLLPDCAQTVALKAHSEFSSVGVDWQAHNSDLPEHQELVALEVAACEAWNSERWSALDNDLANLGVPDEVQHQVHEALAVCENKLAHNVYRAQRRHHSAKALRSLKDPSKSPEAVAELLEFFVDAPSDGPVALILEEAGVSKEEIRQEPLHAVKRLGGELPGLTRKLVQAITTPVDKEWKTLWKNPGKRSPKPLMGVQVKLHDLLAPVLLGDEVLCDTDAYQELASSIATDDESSMEQRRQTALRRLRTGPPELLPVRAPVGNEVAKILNAFFANWRLKLDGEAVCANVRRHRNSLTGKPINNP